VLPGPNTRSRAVSLYSGQNLMIIGFSLEQALPEPAADHDPAASEPDEPMITRAVPRRGPPGPVGRASLPRAGLAASRRRGMITDP
jgi:hypothetical protein